MSITFMLKAENQEDVRSVYAPKEMACHDYYSCEPDLLYCDYESSDTEHVWSGEYFTHSNGWTTMVDTAPELNRANGNAMAMLDYLGLPVDYCGSVKPEDVEVYIDKIETHLITLMFSSRSEQEPWKRMLTILYSARDFGWGMYWC